MARKNKYPVLYTSKETIFTHRGLGTLKDCIDPEVIEERNGVFELELTYPVGSFLFDNLVKGNIIKADASETLVDQLFRIYRISKAHNNRVKVTARHISFDSAYDFIENVTLENASCEYALNEIFRASTFCKDFRGYSDIINAQDYSMQYTNPLSAIAGKQGSIIDTYGTGAEILRDNKNIHVLNSRGKNNSVLISYRKNLTGLEAVEDTTNLITRIFPYVKKTVDEVEAVITLSEKYVDSPRIFDYEHPFIKEIDFSSQFKNDEEVTQSALKLKAEQYFINNKCDIPKINYKIQFEPLSQTLNYASDYKCLENIDICDTVIVRDSRYNINTEAKVIKVRRNPITKKIIALELGEPKSSLGSLIGNGGATPGPPGPPGPAGPPGADGNVGDFPDSLPDVPILEAKSIGLASIELSWSYENKAYYKYELYASKTKDFLPNIFDLIFEGQASAFLHQVQPNETWYYRTRAVNSHGKATEFSTQVKAETFKIGDAATWFEEAAIGEALIGTLSADRAWVGKFSGHYIDARNLSVTDGNGKRTLDIDSFGNVNLDVTTLKIKSDSAVTKTELTTTANQINNSITSVDGKYNAVTQEIKDGVNQFKVSVGQSGGDNLIKNGRMKNGIKFYTTWKSNIYINEGNLVVAPSNGGDSNFGVITSEFTIIKGKKYRISFQVGSFFSISSLNYNYIMSNEMGNVAIQNVGVDSSTTNLFERSIIITAPYTVNDAKIMLGCNINNADTKLHGFRLNNISVFEGDIQQIWKPHSTELYGSSIKLDGEEFEVAFTNGTKMTVSKDLPLTLVDGSTNRQYHALSESGTIVLGGYNGTFPVEAWVQLPAIFKGKQFKVSTSMNQTQGGHSDYEWVQKIRQDIIEYDYANGRFKLWGSWWSRTTANDVYQKELMISWMAIA